MLKKLTNVLEVFRCLGWKSSVHRASRLIESKIGLGKILRSEVTVDNRLLNGVGIPSCSQSPDEFYTWWRSQPLNFLCADVEALKELILPNIKQVEVDKLVHRAEQAVHGKILAFRAWNADFGEVINTSLDPVTKEEWPGNAHSLDIDFSVKGRSAEDIKFTWEFGRFLHVVDVIRAIVFADRRDLLTPLIQQIERFEELNPVYRGVHWISEQEVGIRVSMFCLLLSSLKVLNLLDQKIALLLLRQIAAGAKYCFRETNYARQCINNNHVIGGSIGMYFGGILLNWLPFAERWRCRGRKYILESLAQWRGDGGYVQASHNYHRLAIDYLFWINRIAAIVDDKELENRIVDTCKRSFSFFSELVDLNTGRIANWGPNDGAQFNIWTFCDYADYRPLVNTLSYIVHGNKTFETGPWDEQLVWLWGKCAQKAKVKPIKQSSHVAFSETGLEVVRSEKTMAALRTGPISSRYGQQADLLNLDIFWREKNVVADQGSFSYGKHLYHKWFKSALAHNTITINGLDQMVSASQFLYINWPKSGPIHTRISEPDLFLGTMAGFHDGYKRLPEQVRHLRFVGLLRKGIWLIYDRLEVAAPSSDAHANLGWHFADVDFSREENGIKQEFPDGSFSVKWACSSNFNVKVNRGSENPVMGWRSNYYGIKQESIQINLETRLRQRIEFGTLLGESANIETQDLSICDGGFALNDQRVAIEFDV
jgi:hypothetical protein